MKRLRCTVFSPGGCADFVFLLDDEGNLRMRGEAPILGAEARDIAPDDSRAEQEGWRLRVEVEDV